ncbi:MAG: hypothetical protein Kow00121_23880 [Elainellaceae cyanobacterium]
MDWILLVAALVVSFLVFGFLVRVVRAAIGTAIAIALVVLALQLVFGIGPNDLWQEVENLWDGLWLRFQPRSEG